MFRGPDNRDEAWSLENLPALPPSCAMIEFMPGPLWNDFEWGGWKTDDNPFPRWREAMRPIAQELETALIDPVSYTHPFKMNGSFVGLEALSCHINYLPPEARRTVGVVFLTEQAREVAQSLLAQQIGAHTFIVAPKELATSEWVKQATRTCRDWTVHNVYDGKLDEPSTSWLRSMSCA
jgi:hypothetical protein